MYIPGLPRTRSVQNRSRPQQKGPVPALHGQGVYLGFRFNTTPYTLHPTPYALHPAPYTLHPTPFTLHPSPFTTRTRCACVLCVFFLFFLCYAFFFCYQCTSSFILFFPPFFSSFSCSGRLSCGVTCYTKKKNRKTKKTIHSRTVYATSHCAATNCFFFVSLFFFLFPVCYMCYI